MSENTRREFLKKTGKAIVSGMGWSAVSILGIQASGCSDSNFWCDYCKSCTYSCNDCTSCTSSTGDETITTGVRLILSGWGFSSQVLYNVNASTDINDTTMTTGQFGTWNGNVFSGNFSIQHRSYDDVRVEISRDIFTNPLYTEATFKTFNTSESSVDMTFNTFPTGVYFSVKSNQPPQSSIGTVGVTIKEQASGTTVATETTDANGIIKFELGQAGGALNTGVPYIAEFTKAGFQTTTLNFTVNTDGGTTAGYVEVVYLPTA